LFLNKVESADFPLMSKEALESLAREVVVLGRLLISASGDYYQGYAESNKLKIHHETKSLRRQPQEASDKAVNEIGNVDFVKTGAPFTVDPAMQDLWCNYRQRAKQITQ
jgi:hypothetical protein